MRGEWSGDVDLNGGKLALLHLECQRLLEETSRIGLEDRHTSSIIAAASRLLWKD